MLNLEMITGNWVMTLFTGYFPSHIMLPVLDNFFYEGWPSIYRFALALLSLWEEEFLALNDIAFVSKKVHTLREEFSFNKRQLFEIA